MVVLRYEYETVADAAVLCCAYVSCVLQSRAKLIDDTDSLRRQNAELRILLHQYVTSQAS